MEDVPDGRRKLVVVGAEATDARMMDMILRANRDVAHVLTVPPELLTTGYDLGAGDSMTVFSMLARGGRRAALALAETALAIHAVGRKSKGWRRHVRRAKAAKRRSH